MDRNCELHVVVSSDLVSYQYHKSQMIPFIPSEGRKLRWLAGDVEVDLVIREVIYDMSRDCFVVIFRNFSREPDKAATLAEGMRSSGWRVEKTVKEVSY